MGFRPLTAQEKAGIEASLKKEARVVVDAPAPEVAVPDAPALDAVAPEADPAPDAVHVAVNTPPAVQRSPFKKK